ncbi:biliverdin-producing heme oxygenase [Aquimarina sp. W85]|uniref:biliverdin-producing heme oxygenase n=1 Tax=Aquimarina rhodophyticola TaxID=3342246 RepID=UPI00366DC5BC
MLKILKEKTAALHQEVERLNDAGLIMNHTINVTAYKNLLLENLCAYLTIEKYISDHTTLLPSDMQSFVSMKKSEALRKDLAQIRTESEVNVLTLTEIPSQMQLIGMLYVIEGSMLGGMMISKQLPHCNALSTINEHHFFGGDNKAHVARWKSFCAIIEANKFTDKAINEAVKGAHTAFNIFKQAYYKAPVKVA